jgi:hypothetical protein
MCSLTSLSPAHLRWLRVFIFPNLTPPQASDGVYDNLTEEYLVDAASTDEQLLALSMSAAGDGAVVRSAYLGPIVCLLLLRAARTLPRAGFFAAQQNDLYAKSPWLIKVTPSDPIAVWSGVLHFSAMKLAAHAFRASLSRAPSKRYSTGKPDDITVVLGMVVQQ